MLAQWRDRYREQQGASILEVLVGSSIAALVLFAAADMGLQALRYQQADDTSFVQQNQSLIGLDWFVADARQASKATLDSESDLTLTVGGEAVTYRFAPATGEVVRTDRQGARVVARGVASLTFSTEDHDRSVRATLLVNLPDGRTYRVTSKAGLRAKSPS